MDNKNIKQAFTDFENDDFLEAKDKLKKEILKAKNTFLKNKLNLKNDVIDDISYDDVEDDYDNKE